MSTFQTGIPASAIARSFSAAAPTYDAHADLQRSVVDELGSLLPADAVAHSVLDLGSGTGYCSDRLRARFPAANLTNLDIAEGMLRYHASRILPRSCAMVCADASMLPFRQDSFDLVFSSLALQWSSDPVQVFSELVRVSRPGALILVSTLVPPTLSEVGALWAKVDEYRHVNRFSSVDVLQSAAREAGLDIRLQLNSAYYRTHTDLQSLATEMKGLGAHNLNREQGRGLTGKNKYQRLLRAFAAACDMGVFRTRFEVCLLKMSVPGGKT